MAHNFMPGHRVKYKNAEGVVVERGATVGKRFVVVDFHTPVKFRKKFVNSDIDKLRSA